MTRHVHSHSTSARSYAARHVLVMETLPMCGGLPRMPLGECPSAIRLPLPSSQAPDLLDVAPRAAEQRIQSELEREIQTECQRRSFGTELRLHHGLEREPQPQYQLRRELIALAAKLIELPPAMRASMVPTPFSSIRSIRESQELERSAERATYLQIEEFKGPSPMATTMAAEAEYAGAGLALFAGGALAARVFRAALSDRFRVQPQPWPPGLQINGRFN